MDQVIDEVIDPQIESSGLSSLPVELLVHILSFLAASSMRDVVKMRYVSRMFHSACDTPSLWKSFIWSHFDNTEERCVRNVLKSCGRHIKRLSFPDHVMPSKLVSMFKYCINLTQLSIPTSELSAEQLRKTLEPMKYLESLDVPWNGNIYPLLLITARLKDLTVREGIKKVSSSTYCSFFNDLWMKNWVKEGFQPQTINIVSSKFIPSVDLIKLWFDINSTSPPGLSGCVKMYHSLKVPMNLFPALPEFLLQFGQSCTLPYLKASKYGLLGLERDLLLLTNSTDGEHKAKLVMLSNINEGSHLKSDVADLTFITHFDASLCNKKLLHSGHLEQLAMICPNLHQLNLRNNINCLTSLQGLRLIAICCSKMKGLNLLGISVKDVESRVQLWKILVDLQLLYLAIEMCVLFPFGEDDETKTVIIGSYEKCSRLQALESYCGGRESCRCANCRSFISEQSQLLSNFPSLTHCLTADMQYRAMQNILSTCKKLKYFRYSHANPSWTLSQNCSNLEQLYIESSGRAAIPDEFMNAVSAHFELVHVVLQAYSVSSSGITVLIANSPKLITCHIVTRFIRHSEGAQFNMKSFMAMLKKKFPNRKLFNCGSCHLEVIKHDYVMDIIKKHDNTDLTSLWT